MPPAQPWLWDPRVQQWVPNPQYRPPRGNKHLLVIIGVLVAAVVLVGGVLVYLLTSRHTCPTDTMWSDAQGRCVSAWIEPPPPTSSKPTAETCPPGTQWSDAEGRCVPASTPAPKLTLTFTGLGPLRLGMTVAEAKAADPSVNVKQDQEEYGSDCYVGSNKDADLTFNPDGKLSYIAPLSKDVATQAGIKPGSSGTDVQAAYELVSTTYMPEGFSGIYVGPDGAEMEDGDEWPAIGIDFGDSGDPVGTDGAMDIASATVQGVYLEGGQVCFG